MDQRNDESTETKGATQTGEELTQRQLQRLLARLQHVGEQFALDTQVMEALTVSASTAMAIPIQSTSEKAKALKTFSNDLLKHGIEDELLAVAICEAGNVIWEDVLKYEYRVTGDGHLTMRIRLA